MELVKLEKIIELKKEELWNLVSNYGFQHEKVIELSQEIDKLINWFMFLK
ncbi:Spo0E family sporulation regulatory protein-aspartic acid phosphatase [Bacillus cereus]|uniref:Spo0E family sporulation regulatory protein-aspartic acid phosphatase n=1 Tax=Bacillus cereus TaxID=1396 RepID=A0A2C1F6E0_BACCE|nr:MULTISPECIES: aspartyl-phosphate phosphatase Spo0E family protein [Bacillus cereus group]MDR4984684.1 aspartyl-phosphate phosphatase Spo0E family protein [Bacillus cereus]MEA1011097.1 aspartyl-phosphate phosphatase Spo0E family protein [Bacillus cereus]PES97977.1 Spo0E family sporulation regulatory protein-aspartic acid phosphatase [Bacillus cereus]PFP74340.1 Spo0E family sporulation regulatory protein-aspartic acid phosphatase [Bacillus cereus]PGT20527.1 Spo0E family sporulation regulatory